MKRALLRMSGLASMLLVCASNASARSSEHQHRQTHKASKPPPCYAHYRAAHAIKAVQPTTPQLAQADGITVIGAQAISGPVLLRRAAVDAALATTFVPEIRDCHPIPGAYSYFIDFSGA